MPIHPNDQLKIDEFLADIAPFREAYAPPSFRFIAVRSESVWVIFQGLLRFRLEPLPQATFRSADLRVVQLDLGNDADALPAFLDQLLEGSVEVDGERFIFPPEHTGKHNLYYVPFDGTQREEFGAGRLKISGTNNYISIIQGQAVARQLKMNPISYSSVADFAAHHGLKFDNDMNIHISIDASRVAMVSPASSFENGKAELHFRLAKGLDVRNAHMSVRVGDAQDRDALTSLPAIAWADDVDGLFREGRAILEYPGYSFAVLISYKDRLQDERPFQELPKWRDPLRFAYEFVDRKAAFSGVIEKGEVSARKPRELEDVVGALLAMSGFRTMMIDHIDAIDEAPDIMAADDRNNLLLVECTIKLPYAEDKLDKIFRKTANLARALRADGLTKAEILPVLAVSLDWSDIREHLPAARRSGVLLWGRSDLHALLTPMPANVVFDRALHEFWLQSTTASLSSTIELRSGFP